MLDLDRVPKAVIRMFTGLKTVLSTNSLLYIDSIDFLTRRPIILATLGVQLSVNTGKSQYEVCLKKDGTICVPSQPAPMRLSERAAQLIADSDRF